jgi:hypothetical protein
MIILFVFIIFNIYFFHEKCERVEDELIQCKRAFIDSPACTYRTQEIITRDGLFGGAGAKLELHIVRRE